MQGEILFAKEGPTLAKKLLNYVAIWVGFEYEPQLSFMLLKRCSGSFVEIICFMTDHVFLKSELTESSLSWKNIFLASLMRKLYLLRYLLCLQPNSVLGWFLLMSSPFDYKLSVNPSWVKSVFQNSPKKPFSGESSGSKLFSPVERRGTKIRAVTFVTSAHG